MGPDIKKRKGFLGVSGNGTVGTYWIRQHGEPAQTLFVESLCGNTNAAFGLSKLLYHYSDSALELPSCPTINRPEKVDMS
jgi:hypothetical protein